MRTTVFLLTAGLAAWAAGGTPAAAADSQWCAQFDVFTRNCSYASHDACAAAISGLEARCVVNPGYQPEPKPVAHKTAPGKPAGPQR